MDRDWDLSLRMMERYLRALSVIQHHKKLASKVTKELVTGWCITKRVKRLASNEIELGMEIPTIESQASNIRADNGNYVCCHKGSTDQDLHRICRNQYGHLGPAIGYWPEKHLGHAYIILDPVGSARLIVRWRYSIIWVMYVGDQMLFEVPDEITNMMRSSRGKYWYIGW